MSMPSRIWVGTRVAATITGGPRPLPLLEVVVVLSEAITATDSPTAGNPVPPPARNGVVPNRRTRTTNHLATRAGFLRSTSRLRVWARSSVSGTTTRPAAVLLKVGITVRVRPQKLRGFALPREWRDGKDLPVQVYLLHPKRKEENGAQPKAVGLLLRLSSKSYVYVSRCSTGLPTEVEVPPLDLLLRLLVKIGSKDWLVWRRSRRTKVMTCGRNLPATRESRSTMWAIGQLVS